MEVRTVALVLMLLVLPFVGVSPASAEGGGNVTIHASSIEHVGGTQPNMSAIGVDFQSPEGDVVLVRVTNGTSGNLGFPYNLTDQGVDQTTRFRLDVTVENYEPNAFMWGGDDVNMTVVNNSTQVNYTDVIVKFEPVHMAGILGESIGPQDYDQFSWGGNGSETADVGWNNTAYFGLVKLNESGTASLDGAVLSSNAQKFSPPVYNESSNQIKMRVAAPHFDTTGENHTGFYEVQIPQAVLDDWNVTDPDSELQVEFQGQDINSTVTNTSKGATVRVDDIHYSSGDVVVGATNTAGGGSGDDGGDGVGGGAGGGLPFGSTWGIPNLVFFGGLIVVIGSLYAAMREEEDVEYA